ncbi:hypothetical protein HJFPF1_13342 [Paramyrothecium foliicola]|nr:hypothetical protein HJFPF1_13342 [Paramyrothecium foliicola]
MKFFALVSLLAVPSEAALRFGCSTVSIQRIDPLVLPGHIPSGHLHQIVGGNAFNATMDPADGDIANKATCTTCTFSEDFSNYWTAVMFFKHPNGSYHRVPIMQNTALPNGINGGMTIYYTQQDFFSNGNQKITAFRPASARIFTTQAAELMDLGLPNADRRQRSDLTEGRCPGGIMTVHHFPACWDGKNLDSPDHMSHMYNTVGEAFNNAGPCPASHPVRVPQLAYETLWDTTKFNNMWPTDGSQPFILSNGDVKGFTTHADYVFGWKGDSLQRAMDSSCMFNACENGQPLKSQGVNEMNRCTVRSQATENIDGWLPGLPGRY